MAQRIVFFDEERIDDNSPKTKTRVLTIQGDVLSAKVTVILDGKFGWELDGARFNEKELPSPRIWEPFKGYISTNKVVSVDVVDAIRSGENTLVVLYHGLPWQSTNLSAYLDIDTTSSLPVIALPDIPAEVAEWWKGLSTASWQVLVALVLIALIGFIAWRFLGGFF